MSGGGQFDPFNQARLPAPPLEGKSEERYSVNSALFYNTNPFYSVLCMTMYM